jgi:hypothetical protein
MFRFLSTSRSTSDFDCVLLFVIVTVYPGAARLCKNDLKTAPLLSSQDLKFQRYRTVVGRPTCTYLILTGY